MMNQANQKDTERRSKAFDVLYQCVCDMECHCLPHSQELNEGKCQRCLTLERVTKILAEKK